MQWFGPKESSMRWIAATFLGVLLLGGPAVGQVSQVRHWSGQGAAPVYEGFDINPDGTFNMWFGYMNRNFEEELDVPIGPENKFEPGPADRGQPTHFDTRRRKDMFRVVVPKDFGATNKLTWTLNVRGKSEQVSGTLNSVWEIDRRRTTRGGNSQSIDSNTPPVVRLEPTTATVAQRSSATVSVFATDDGLPVRRGKSVGMTVEWGKYRGPGTVTFTQVKQPLVDGKADVQVSFSAPGDYLLQAVVDDGSGESAGNFGYHCCWTNAQVKVTVSGGEATSGR
jgi:hypothetical protein